MGLVVGPRGHSFVATHGVFMAATLHAAVHGKQASVSKPAQSSAQLGKRLQQELMSLMMSSPPGVTAFPSSDESMIDWTGRVEGPAGTLYEGLAFRLSIIFPPDYPYVAPTIRFETPCFHPNLTLQGDVCLNSLKEEYSPALSLSSILLSIQALFEEPNPASPLNIEAADLWNSDRVAYKREIMRHYRPID